MFRNVKVNLNSSRVWHFVIPVSTSIRQILLSKVKWNLVYIRHLVVAINLLHPKHWFSAFKQYVNLVELFDTFER